MALEDVLSTFAGLYRATLYDETEWVIKQKWTSIWADSSSQYSPVYFSLHLTKSSMVCINVCQLDARYFLGFDGNQIFHMEFLVRLRDCEEGEYVTRNDATVRPVNRGQRSVHTEVDLEAGIYEILVMVTAEGRPRPRSADTIPDAIAHASLQPLKLRRLKRNYDIAHSRLELSSAFATWEDDADMIEHDGSKLRAKCGIGLRVFSKDPDMTIEICNRNAGLATARGGAWGSHDEQEKENLPWLWNVRRSSNRDHDHEHSRHHTKESRELYDESLYDWAERKLGIVSQFVG
ncbi:hypothetical protein Slin15195_G046310 [Septoria linicola]|uniref:Uncharacterized protein n=1 Tax=Septoria linicola TaxID=215465 RepID=A0A9Q9ASQ1_9PEZI|nr:hypothetical protein Slin14017_G049840 [Septoria linicola]USW51312.1 hypothetical protein Slin15195_G046310 [Septoria linicola]